MSEQNQPYARLLSQYHSNQYGKEQQSATQREIAVAAALSLLDSHAMGGTGTNHVGNYKLEIGPLADAIQEALKTEK